MKLVRLLTLITLLWGGGAAAVQAQDPVRQPTESDLVFAERALDIGTDSAPHVVAASWNGVATLFVDYVITTKDETERPIVALQRLPDGRYRLVRITIGEEEGGTAVLEAIGFARADHSGDKALITILSWPAAGGTLYEVRIFAAPRPGQTELTPMKISKNFDLGCECSHGGGPPKYDAHFRFQTIAAVKRELTRLGY
jgi:hypothetical protein